MDRAKSIGQAIRDQGRQRSRGSENQTRRPRKKKAGRPRKKRAGGHPVRVLGEVAGRRCLEAVPSSSSSAPPSCSTASATADGAPRLPTSTLARYVTPAAASFLISFRLQPHPVAGSYPSPATVAAVRDRDEETDFLSLFLLASLFLVHPFVRNLNQTASNQSVRRQTS